MILQNNDSRLLEYLEIIGSDSSTNML